MKIWRKGWNGKDMYVVRQAGYPNGIAINANTSKAIGQPEGTVCRFSPYLMMRAADGSFVPWLASQTDILADDWECESSTVSSVQVTGAEVTLGGKVFTAKRCKGDHGMDAPGCPSCQPNWGVRVTDEDGGPVDGTTADLVLAECARRGVKL